MGPDLSGIRVLVVDDDRDCLQVTGLVLEMTGAKVCCATSARDALQRLNDFLPEIVVTDISMPEFSGVALLGAIRDAHAAEGRRIPVIALSGVIDREEGIARGFDDYIVKPADPDHIVRKVHSLVIANKDESLARQASPCPPPGHPRPSGTAGRSTG